LWFLHRVWKLPKGVLWVATLSGLVALALASTAGASSPDTLEQRAVPFAIPQSLDYPDTWLLAAARGSNESSHAVVANQGGGSYLWLSNADGGVLSHAPLTVSPVNALAVTAGRVVLVSVGANPSLLNVRVFAEGSPSNAVAFNLSVTGNWSYPVVTGLSIVISPSDPRLVDIFWSASFWHTWITWMRRSPR